MATTELTSEEVVTKILSEHQILKRSKENFYLTNQTGSLGEYLLNLPEDEAILKEPSVKDSRFSFISGSWSV